MTSQEPTELAGIIFQKHLRFMTVLQRNFKNIPSDDFYELEGQFKDMCQLANKYSGADAFSDERMNQYIQKTYGVKPK